MRRALFRNKMKDPPLDDDAIRVLRGVGADCNRKNDGKRACGRQILRTCEELVIIESKAS
jgi:hypothetical protein